MKTIENLPFRWISPEELETAATEAATKAAAEAATATAITTTALTLTLALTLSHRTSALLHKHLGSLSRSDYFKEFRQILLVDSKLFLLTIKIVLDEFHCAFVGNIAEVSTLLLAFTVATSWINSIVTCVLIIKIKSCECILLTVVEFHRANQASGLTIVNLSDIHVVTTFSSSLTIVLSEHTGCCKHCNQCQSKNSLFHTC